MQRFIALAAVERRATPRAMTHSERLRRHSWLGPSPQTLRAFALVGAATAAAACSSGAAPEDDTTSAHVTVQGPATEGTTLRIAFRADEGYVLSAPNLTHKPNNPLGGPDAYELAVPFKSFRLVNDSPKTIAVDGDNQNGGFVLAPGAEHVSDVATDHDHLSLRVNSDYIDVALRTPPLAMRCVPGLYGVLTEKTTYCTPAGPGSACDTSKPRRVTTEVIDVDVQSCGVAHASPDAAFHARVSASILGVPIPSLDASSAVSPTRTFSANYLGQFAMHDEANRDAQKFVSTLELGADGQIRRFYLSGAVHDVVHGWEHVVYETKSVTLLPLTSFACPEGAEPQAVFTQHPVPEFRPFVVGESADMFVTVANCTHTTWRRGDVGAPSGVKLGLDLEAAANVWQFNRAALPVDVPPGQAVRVPYRLTKQFEPSGRIQRAPWQMVDEMVAWIPGSSGLLEVPLK